MLTDAGSIPAVSTNSDTGLDHSRPAIILKHQSFNQLPKISEQVSESPNGSSVWHHSVTNWTQDVTDKFGTNECKLFRKKIFDRFEPLSVGLAKEYLAIVKRQNYVEANRRLSERSCQLQIKELNLTKPDANLKQFARQQALKCLHIKSSSDEEIAHSTCLNHAKSYQLDIPKQFDDSTYCLNRLTDETWWIRSIRRLRNRRLSEIERDMGIVSKFESAYSSDRSANQRRFTKRQQRKYLENTTLQNHKGQKYSLAELSDKSTSNPEKRRSELMTRISGFEKVASICGHACYFHTLTTPSRMHRCLSKVNKPNPKFDGSTPREAQNYLRMLWARIRAAFARADIKVYGFRISEPHHDATPHWHFMLFVPKTKAEEMNSIMRRYALAEDGYAKGAEKFRFKAVEIDTEKGSAAGYIAKYISKNIDGKHIDEDTLGNPAMEAAEKIEGWARDHSLRQFQQIGGAPVTVWRELRRIEIPVSSPTAECARQAADSGDWAAYIFAMGGIDYSRDKSPITTLYQHLEAVDLETGELVRFTKNKYGETKQPPIRGLILLGEPIITRQFAWSTDRKLLPLDSVNNEEPGDSPGFEYSAGISGTWTRVNKCTEANSMSLH